jgi:hypothetical protein
MKHAIITLFIVILLEIMLLISVLIQVTYRNVQPLPLAPKWQAGACIYYQQDDAGCDTDW